MKKLLNTSFIYLGIALASGVFYRELTRSMNFSGRTSLSLTHTHLIVLGTLMFLFLTLFLKDKKVHETKLFKNFFVIYNIAVIFFTATLFTRGIVEVLVVDLSYGIDKMISGMAGLSHILLTVSFVLLYKVLKKALVEE